MLSIDKAKKEFASYCDIIKFYLHKFELLYGTNYTDNEREV